MADTYEAQLLALTPLVGTFAPGSLPLGEILAYSTTSSDPAVEKAMRGLAQELPFRLGAWPSFTTDVNDNYRVRVQAGAIDVVLMERGLGTGPVGLSFVEAFHQVLRLLVPEYSAEAQPVAESLDPASRRLVRKWLVNASLIKHMYEVNAHFGRRAAIRSLTWMCEELVRMQACATMREAVESEATLVHALQLGGIPEQQARDIYHEFMPQSTETAAIGQQAIMVSDAAFNASDSAALVGGNAAIIQRQLDAYMRHDELSADALRSYYVEYFLRQITQGGFAQFVYNTGWDSAIVSQVRQGLKAMGAAWHLQLFDRAAELMKKLSSRQRHQFLRSPALAGAGDGAGKGAGEGGDGVAQKVAAMLNRYTAQFMAEEETKSLRAYNAAWLHGHHKLTVLPADEVDAELRRRIDAFPDRQMRTSKQDLRVQRLFRALCEQISQEPLENQQVVKATHDHEGEQLPAWYFSTGQGDYFLIDLVDRAVMFDADTNVMVGEIDATEERFMPGVSIDKDLVPHFVQLIETDDYSGIESARFDVEPRHLARLIEHYDTLESHDHKRAFVDLVDQQSDARLQPIMLDFLQLPPGSYDAMRFARAFALGFITGHGDDRTQFYGANVDQLEHDIATLLLEHGSSGETH